MTGIAGATFAGATGFRKAVQQRAYAGPAVCCGAPFGVLLGSNDCRKSFRLPGCWTCLVAVGWPSQLADIGGSGDSTSPACCSGTCLRPVTGHTAGGSDSDYQRVRRRHCQVAVNCL